MLLIEKHNPWRLLLIEKHIWGPPGGRKKRKEIIAFLGAGAKKARVGSSGERNTGCELSSWRHEAKRFPGTSVKSESNSIEIGLAISG